MRWSFWTRVIFLSGLGLCIAAEADEMPAPKVAGVEFGGEIAGEGAKQAGVLFQDGAESFAVPGGTLWCFGDTFLGRNAPGLGRPTITGAIANSVAFLPMGAREFPLPLRYLTGADGVARRVLMTSATEDTARRKIWPLGGITLGDRIYLFYSMIETTESGPPGWNFRDLGGGLAVTDHAPTVFRRCQTEGSWRYPVEPACVVETGGFLYLYEASSEPGRRGLVLARVRPEQIEDSEAYRFFDGQGWCASRAAARVVLREVYGQVSVAWNPALRVWVMATSSDFSHPREIQLRTATDPCGPWSAPTRLAVPERPGKKTNRVYCTYLHSQLDAADGREITLTFCRNLAGTWELCNPEWVRVRFSDGYDRRGRRERSSFKAQRS